MIHRIAWLVLLVKRNITGWNNEAPHFRQYLDTKSKVNQAIDNLTSADYFPPQGQVDSVFWKLNKHGQIACPTPSIPNNARETSLRPLESGINQFSTFSFCVFSGRNARPIAWTSPRILRNAHETQHHLLQSWSAQWPISLHWNAQATTWFRNLYYTWISFEQYFCEKSLPFSLQNHTISGITAIAETKVHLLLSWRFTLHDSESIFSKTSPIFYWIATNLLQPIMPLKRNSIYTNQESLLSRIRRLVIVFFVTSCLRS